MIQFIEFLFLTEMVDPELRRNRREMMNNFKKLDKYSNWNAEHSIQVAKLSRDFGKLLGLNSTKLINSTLNHDIGKIEIDKRVLHKPGKLSKDESEYIHTHVDKTEGAFNKMTGDTKRLAQLGSLFHHMPAAIIDRMVSENSLTHEEGQIIKVITICDVFEALTSSHRPYKKGSTKFDALELMKTLPFLDKELLKNFIDWQYSEFTNEFRDAYIEKHRQKLSNEYEASHNEYEKQFNKMKQAMDGQSPNLK